MPETTDITQVCAMLGTTSRTLRFYEQKGIIESTVTKFGTRRQYSTEQISEIKKVLVLRSLGLSVAQILKLKNGSQELSSVISEQKAHLLASINSKAKELNLLEEAFTCIENGEDIFQREQMPQNREETINSIMTIAGICTDAFIDGNYEKMTYYFSDNLRSYTPPASFAIICKDMLIPLGLFVGNEKTVFDKEYGNIVYSYLNYEKLGLIIKYVFHRDLIHGIWLNYYSEEHK